MWTNFPSTRKVSRSHLLDLDLRTKIWELWSQLPKGFRETWSSHPESKTYGDWFTFWNVNYFRWRLKLGPLLRWPEEYFTYAPYIDSYWCEAKGTSVKGFINFDHFGQPGLLAIAFYPYHRWNVFGSGLKELRYLNMSKRFDFQFNGLRPGFQKGQIAIFTTGGTLQSVDYLPTVFCK